MGKIFLKILKILAVIILIAGIGALLFWLCRSKGWPLWVGGAILAGLIGLVITVLFVKKHLLRSREKKFVQRVIEQDRSAIKTSPAGDRQQLLELQENWKNAIERLQKSKLRKLGNPLYVLPWYLIMGESGSGKTSAVKNARIDSSMTEVSRSAGISGTRNCDWWFFDKAVILDTAGRYAVPVDEGQDLEEWKRFLVLLSQYRKKEPLNGVVVAVAADKLLTADEATLREEGHCIRQRIDQMMRTIGARSPVYLLVTKMDLVHGFCDFSSQLPGSSLSQAMGFTHDAPHPRWQEILSAAITRIADNLKALRLVVLHKTPRPAPGVVIFPNEFERLEPGLSGFLNALFEENAYQETPLLKGLYFSSALRSGPPVSDFLQAADVSPPPSWADDSGGALFIRDFFSQILPAGRNLFSPLKEYLLWRRLTQQLGLVAWLLIGACACGLLTFSFFKNHSALATFQESFFDPPKLSDDRSTDLLTLDKIRLEILEMEETNRSWWLPRLGLRQSIEVEARLKNHFARLFNGGFLIPLDYWLGTRIRAVSEKTPEAEFVDYIGYVVARISVLEEQVAGKRLTDQETFQRITAALIEGRDKGTSEEVADEFANIYYAYLTWGRDLTDTQESIQNLRRALIQLLSKKGSDLRWLVEKWVPGVPTLHLNDFWGSAAIGQAQGKVIIPGGFTQSGRQHIEAFIQKIAAALGDSPMQAEFQENTKQFWVWYRQQFFQSWETFISEFHEASVRIDSIAGWQRLVGLMSTRQNPYFQLLNRAADETEAMKPEKDAPEWARLILRLKQIRNLAQAQQAKQQEGSLVGTLKVKTEELKGQALASIAPEDARKQETMMAQAAAMNAFLQAMDKLEGTVASSKQAFDSYSACFSYLDDKGGAGAPSPFTTAYDSYYKLKNTLFNDKDVPVVWDLIFGPLDFIMAFAADETACFLQQQWEEQVLGAIDGADPAKVPALLFDKTNGVVLKFVNGTAKPFLGRGTNGYYARRDFRKNRLPFSGEFIHFLNAGADAAVNSQPDYSVTLATVPIAVNEGAQVEPFGNVLTVDCSEKSLTIENYNFPNSADFTWAPDKCGDAVLRIALPDLTLEKRYPGNLGFANFLKDFRDGSRKFTPADFPEQAGAIKRAGISWLRVTYKITGAAPVIQLLSKPPTNVPADIIACWHRSHQ